MEIPNAEERTAAMTARVRQTLQAQLAQSGKDDADAELLDMASSAIVELAFFDAGMMLGQGLSIVSQSQIDKSFVECWHEATTESLKVARRQCNETAKFSPIWPFYPSQCRKRLAQACWSEIKSRLNPEFRSFVDALIGLNAVPLSCG